MRGNQSIIRRPSSLVIMISCLLMVFSTTQCSREREPSTPPSTPPAGFELIPSGSFTMGSPADEPGRSDDEEQHRVTISRDFWLQSTEVTQGEWLELMGSSPSYYSECGENCPVERVSWWDAVSYCNALSRREGLEECYELRGCSGVVGGGCASGERFCLGNYECRGVDFVGLSCLGYRLPTESEWEYAARAGTTGSRYGELDVIAWYYGNSGGRTHEVGVKAPNAWGLYDMLGNVAEWTWDLYGDYPRVDERDPLGHSGGSSRVFRGGGWGGAAHRVRSALRRHDLPAYRLLHLGFRPARTVP